MFLLYAFEIYLSLISMKNILIPFLDIVLPYDKR